jgi:hypothetical protein
MKFLLIVFISLWCRFETMSNLFNAQICFNVRNPYLFKVRDDVTLNDLKDQLNEINQGFNLGNTQRMEDVQYGRPGLLQSDKILLTNDNCVRSMFSVFCQHRMFPRIEMDATLLRSHEYILKSFIMAEDYI